MKLESSYITVDKARFYAYHGVMPQERRVGGWFTVSLRVGFDFSRAMESDSLNDTLSYAGLYEVVRREMDVPSQLLEHVAGRIARAIGEVSGVESIDLWLTKENPPMDADSDGSGVEIHLINNKSEGK